MKKIQLVLSAVLFISIGISVFAQEYPEALKVKEYKLSNGLTIYLNEDHSQPLVFGGVLVKGGAKVDPQNATGIAHYLEHMMFKGTDKLGTINYKAEKVYLDSIQMKYDELAKLEGEEERKEIQIQINRLSLKAGEYAIPNEFDKILSNMGATSVNAFTSMDCIFYFNMFPPNYLEKWMKLYSHRFENPVFRLFQSELETVYEEKNMSMDNFGSIMINTFQENFYKKSPYGQQTVLGDIEHLKNPALRQMYEYYNTYYVANNMALIMSGDFDIKEIMPRIEKYFGEWKTGNLPELKEYKEEPFDGREFVSKRITPIPIGILGYRTVPQGHKDALVLEVISNLLSNEAYTGYLDKLYMDNKIMMSGLMNFEYNDDGAGVLFFVPKIFRQTLRNSEKLVLNELNKIKFGEFDQEYLESIKVNLKKYHQQRLEDLKYRPYYIMDAFLLDKSWNEMLEYSIKLDKITKDDVISVANKYFNENYLCFYSKSGIPKKDKLEKPPYDPIIPKNTEAKSEFAIELDKIATTAVVPKFIEFQEDVKFEDIRNNLHYYYNPNPVNDVFSMEIRYGIGKLKLPELGYATNYVSLIGTDTKDFETFNKELQKLGGSYSIYASNNYLTVDIDGIEENLEPTLQLINELLTSMAPDEDQMEKFVREAKSQQKVESKEARSKSSALYQYALFKDRSYYLQRLNLKEIKKLESDKLIETIKQALKYEAEIHYCGRLGYKDAKTAIFSNITFHDSLIDTESPIIQEWEKHTENTVYFLNDKKAIQSYINVSREGKSNDLRDRAIATAFNEYFGSGMSSLIFQEIREFRSLAYSAYGYYSTPYHLNDTGFFYASMSTQADKTIEAIAALTNLIDTMPQKPERIEMVKNSLLESINSKRPSFRYLSKSVAHWRKMNYEEDPNKDKVIIYKELEFDDIVRFHEENVLGKPFVITIVGDKSRIDMEELKKFGKIIELKEEEVFGY